MTGLALYAYAFVRANADVPAGLTGIGPRRSPVRLVRRRRLALLVSDVETEQLRDLVRGDVDEQSELAVRAREHDHVVRAVAALGPVLPFRFGTVLPDADAVDRLLAGRHDAAVAALAHVAGRQEWGIRLRARRPTGDAPADRSSGTSYLASRGRRLHDIDRRRDSQRDSADAIRADLVGWGADVVDRPGGDAVLDVAVLVADQARDAFLRHVAQLAGQAADAGLLLDTTGPWPPYSFTHIDGEVSDE